MKNEIQTPPHPTVDWSTVHRREDGHREVQVTCPWCKESMWKPASEVASRIKKGTFTGFCYKDRLLRKEQKNRKYPRMPHPQVDWTDTKIIVVKGKRLTSAAVTCPDCSAVRYVPRSQASHHIRDNRFTGRCSKCSGSERKREWQVISKGKKIDPQKGYVRLTTGAIAPADLPLFWAMRSLIKTSSVLEHRFVMSKVLGRPLAQEEFVDHIDGNKINNEPSNLRIYRRGTRDPGNTSGYGTFYHEWQLALARIKELEEQLATKP